MGKAGSGNGRKGDETNGNESGLCVRLSLIPPLTKTRYRSVRRTNCCRRSISIPRRVIVLGKVPSGRAKCHLAFGDCRVMAGAGGGEDSLSCHIAIGDWVGVYPREKQAPHMLPIDLKERRTSLSRDNRRATAYKKRAGRKVAYKKETLSPARRF